MKPAFCVDVCLSRKWSDALIANGYPSVNWRDFADKRAPDSEIVQWAVDNERVILTQDYDFAAILSVDKVVKPSVVQLVEPFVVPDSIGRELLAAIAQYERELLSGALLVVEKFRVRLHLLPFP